MLFARGVDLSTQPLDVLDISTSDEHAKVECARVCKQNQRQCKLYSYSTITKQCRFYQLVDLCDGYKVDPTFNVYSVVFK